MIKLIQEQYEAPTDANSTLEHALVIHARGPDRENQALIIFVHGLGGGRYGTHSTWGNFPAFLYEDMPNVDVGMYQYKSLLGRFSLEKSVELEDEARVFADLLRDDIDGYANVILVGHSMGGLLCKAVVHRLLESGDKQTIRKICGLMLMATPQLGATLIPRLLRFFSPDARALQVHGPLVEKINRAFEDHVALDENVSTIRKATIPTWSVEAVADRWVDTLSAGIGLVSSRRKVVRGSHTSIVKPKSRDSETYQWVKRKVMACLDRYKYEVFVAAAMAGHKTDAEYDQSHQEVMLLVQTLQERCGFKSVFYAGRKMRTRAEWDPVSLALKDDLAALRSSRYFLLYYPQRTVSSVLYEAGWALMLGKPAIYLVRQSEDLPFLMREASQAASPGQVRIIECADHADCIREITAYGDRLFNPLD